MSLNAIAVDDNASTLSLLNDYANKTSQIAKLTTFTSPTEALNHLLKDEVDLVFIDVHMPDISGLDFISIVKKRVFRAPPKFILISAHREHAVEGFELEAIDYLLKPFRFDRFLMSIDKVGADVNHLNEKSVAKEDCIFARQGSKHVKVEPSSVSYVESKGHFVNLYFPHDTPLILSDNITRMEEMLSPYGFLRVHKQYLVNKYHIREADSSVVIIDSTKKAIPIGRKYKDFINSLAS